MKKFENLHILIAEDDVDDGEIVVKSFLDHHAFTSVEWVKNGRELLEYLNGNNSKPDVILTDINMPVLNGIEALQEICRNRAFSQIPIFVYSSTINPIYEIKCRELGTKAFLTKPYNLHEFDHIPEQIITRLKAEMKFVN